MNKVFKTVWSKTLLTWVPVAEISKAHRGCACGRSRRKLRAGTQSPLRNIAAAAVAALSGAVLLAIPVAHATSYTVTQILSDGSTVSLLPGDTITTNNASGVNVTNGTYTLASGNNVTVNGTAGNIYGLSANGANARIKLNNNTITNNSAGTSSYGLYAVNGGTITGTGSTAVKTSGASSFGLYASGANTSMTFTNTAASPLSVTTGGDNADGIKAASGAAIQAGTAVISTSGKTANGVYATGANSKITFVDVTATVSGNTVSGNGKGGLYTDTNGAILVSGNADITTTGDWTTSIFATGTSTIDVLGNAKVRSENNSGNGVYARSAGAVINLNTADIGTTGTGNWGFLSESGGIINVSGHTDLTTDGDQGYGVNATGAGAKVNLASVTALIKGDNSDGLYANNQGIITISGAADITTTGANSHGAAIDGVGADILLNGDSHITTTGAGSHGVQVINKATKTFNGAIGNILPAITVSGDGSAALDASGAGSVLTLAGNTALSMSMTAGPNTWGAKAEAGGIVNFQGNSNSMGTALWATGTNSVLSFANMANAAGSHVLLQNAGQLDLSATTLSAFDIGSLAGDGTASVKLGSNTLQIGNNNGNSDGSLQNNANYAGKFTGPGNLIKRGNLTQILSGTGNTVNEVDVTGGTLQFKQTGNFSTTGAYTTTTDGTTDIGINGSTLKIGSVFTQQNGANLNVALSAINNSPAIITTDSAQIGGTLNIAGFSTTDALDPAAMQKASTVGANEYHVISTASGITGDFATLTGLSAVTVADYLLVDGHQTADGKGYDVGLELAWTAVDPANRTGSFTMAAGTAFNVDIALGDETVAGAAPNAGWDGKSLTKAGDGTLLLSAQNTYTGQTAVNGGLLRTGINNAFATSSDIIVNSGGILDLNGYNQLANRVQGAGSITLNGAALTANNQAAGTDDTTFGGVISDGAVTGGGLIKTGAGQLTLTGENSFTGLTAITGGTLQIGDGGTSGSIAGDIANQAALVFDRSDDVVYAGQLSGTGSLTKLGSGNLSLTQTGTQGGVTVQSGTLNFAQSGTFSVTGNYLTQTGAATQIGLESSQLIVAGDFTQEAGSTLNVTLGASPDIIARTAHLDGDLVVNGFSSVPPVRASEVAANVYTLISTTGGPGSITGDFAQTNVPGTNLDYLLQSGSIDNNAQDYNLRFKLAWTEGGRSQGTGSFTLNEGTSFNVDIVLENQDVPDDGGFATGWNGRDLTKNGDGLLILSAQNTYTGATTVNGGILQTDAVDAIASSDAVTVNGTLDMNNNNQTLQHLSGAATGQIAMGTADLTAFNDAGRDTSYAGSIAGDGQLIKTGGGELTLSGATAWNGQTQIQGGTLTLDGSAGGGQLVSDVYGQDNTALKLINGATLTGKIDPTDVTVDAASTWNMTANSQVNNLALNGMLNFVPPAAESGYKTLTVGGTLGGNGSLSMNTNLGAQQGDLVVAQATEGQHNVYINNQGSDPSGPGQSLKIIDVSAPALSNGTFVLPSGQVDAGAYRYSLLPGQQVAGGEAGDWYLANTMENSNLTNDVLDAANAAKYATFASLNSLHKRLGELRLDQGIEGDLWTRGYSKDYTMNLGSQIDQTVNGFEVGVDHLIRFNGGRFYTGGLIGAGQANTSSNTNDSGESTNQQVGAYGTWIFDNGSYVDLIGRYFWFKRDYRTWQLGATEYDTGNSQNNALSLDAEAGKRFDFKQGWFVEPQSELNWLRSSQSSFTTSQGNQIGIDSSQTINGRLGLAGGKVLQSDTGRLTQVYGQLDWTKDLSSNGRVSINGNSFDMVKDDGAWIATLGVQTAGGEQNRLQFHIEVEAGLGDPNVKQNWGVNAGLRWAF